MSKISKEKLNEIYNKESNSFFVFLSSYDQEEIEFEGEGESEEEIQKMKALNISCKKIFEVINSNDIEITINEIKNIINTSQLEEEDKDYPEIDDKNENDI